jgi:hypothetical protein
MRLLLFFILITAGMAACKKAKEEPVDMSGSLLDTNIDTVWKAPDNSSVMRIKIRTHFGRSNTSSTYDTYNADLSTSLVSGVLKNYSLKLKYRRFPKNYSENGYPVPEYSYSNLLNNDPVIFPLVGIYYFKPDPGPIDRVEITLQ